MTDTQEIARIRAALEAGSKPGNPNVILAEIKLYRKWKKQYQFVTSPDHMSAVLSHIDAQAAEIDRLKSACDKMSEVEVVAGKPATTRELLQQALDALTCHASEDGYGHVCGRCNENTHTSWELREDIRAELAKPERPINCGTSHCSCIDCVVAQDTCKWTKDDGEMWESSCGSAWFFTDGGPPENGVNFCHNCGKPVEIKETP